MCESPIEELIKIDYDLIEKWNLHKAFEILISSFSSEENVKGIGLYNNIDERDILEITYLILKHAKGICVPNHEDMVSLATKLTLKKLSEDNKAIQYYSLYNGDMPDLHLFFFLDKLFTPYSEKLLKEYGFNHHIVKHLRIFFEYHYSFIFSINDIEKMIKEFWDDKEIQNTLLNMFTKFIEYFSDVPNLENYNSFQKSVSRKPIVKLSDDEYMLCWHWFRNSTILNFHYLFDSSDEIYKKYKSDTFEEITASLFKHHLKSSNIYPSVKYSGGEIDVLVDTQNTILLIECKSKILYEDYKLGVFDENVIKNVDSITGEAKKQLCNAREVLLNKKDLRSNGVKLSLDPNKNILLLNICFEFPIGITNKDMNEDIVVLSLIDLMIIIDLMEEQLLREPCVKNIIDYLDLRKRTLGLATDDELVIAIFLLYSPYLASVIGNADLLSCIQLDSEEDISYINEAYSFMLDAKILSTGEEYQLTIDNYNGFLRQYILEEHL